MPITTSDRIDGMSIVIPAVHGDDRSFFEEPCWYVIGSHARVILHGLHSGSADQELDLGEVDGSRHNPLGAYIPPGLRT